MGMMYNILKITRVKTFLLMTDEILKNNHMIIKDVKT
jgi:hypothetical protein